MHRADLRCRPPPRPPNATDRAARHGVPAVPPRPEAPHPVPHDPKETTMTPIPHARPIRLATRAVAWAAALALALAACTTAPTPPPDDEVDPGALAVLVSGLPSGTAASVSVTGPAGFADTIGASETYTGLTPGTYAVAAASVSSEGITYEASVSGSPAAVPAGGLATATVTYAAASTADGSLTVNVAGLPDGVAADVRVTGPDGFDEAVSATTTFASVAPGVYTVTAEGVDDGGDEYGATVAGSPATVPAGGAAAALVSYAFLDPGAFGALAVTITGLPTGVDADVSVAGPVGFAADLTESTTLTSLTVGNYAVAAADVTVGDLTYQGVVDGSPALVIGGETAAVAVDYRPFVPNDGDAASAPGLHARFRATSPGPVWVQGLLFNAGSPIDTKGLQLRDRLGNPADPGDWIAFQLVHGQGNSTTITISLECSNTDTPSPIRAELRTVAGEKIGLNTLCGGSRNIAVPNVGGSGNYVLHVIPQFGTPYFTEYAVSIDAYCFPACDYQPFEP